MEAFIQIFIAIMIIKGHNNSTARVQLDPVMKFNHLSLIKVESLTFWWSRQSVIWCESSREESKAEVVCMLRLLSCGWQFLLLHQFRLFLIATCHPSFFKPSCQERQKMRRCAVKIGPVETSQYRLTWETAARQVLPYGGGGVCVWGDRWWIDTLRIIWQVLSTPRAPTCALYLDYWLGECPPRSWPVVEGLSGDTGTRLKHFEDQQLTCHRCPPLPPPTTPNKLPVISVFCYFFLSAVQIKTQKVTSCAGDREPRLIWVQAVRIGQTKTSRNLNYQN